MARRKEKKPTYNFNDFFGNANQYHVLGAQTGESCFLFLATLERYLKTDIHSIGEYEFSSKDYDCRYQMAFARLCEPCDITLIIMENKSTLFNQKGYPTAKKEKNLSFHTISMFDEFCYILNAQGISIHKWPFVDMDYLLLYYTRKECNISEFEQNIAKIPKAQVKADNTLLAEDLPDEKKDTRRKFIEDIFCEAQIRSSSWEQEYVARLLGNTKIPDNNLPEIFKLYEDITPIFTSEYLHFAEIDPSYEV